MGRLRAAVVVSALLLCRVATEHCPASYACSGGNWTRCPDGEFSFGGAKDCEPCRAGYVCENGFGIPCGGTADAENPHGFANNVESGGACDAACPAGHGCAAGVAAPCAAGRHAPDGRPAAHTRDCIPCAPGRFANETALAACYACPAGRSSALGAAECAACAAGEFARAGDAPCASCPRGTYALAGDANCTACPAGRFAAEAATNRPCDACPDGTTTAGTGAAACAVTT